MHKLKEFNLWIPQAVELAGVVSEKHYSVDSQTFSESEAFLKSPFIAFNP